MVGSNDEPQEPDRYYSSDHTHLPEWLFFTWIVSYALGDDPKARENENVHLRVTKKSEQMLLEDGVSSSSWV